MQYHPDIKGDTQEATQYFTLLLTAYEVLMDDEKRAAYDNECLLKKSTVYTTTIRNVASITQEMRRLHHFLYRQDESHSLNQFYLYSILYNSINPEQITLLRQSGAENDINTFLQLYIGCIKKLNHAYYDTILLRLTQLKGIYNSVDDTIESLNKQHQNQIFFRKYKWLFILSSSIILMIFMKLYK